jgi:hypothetical protein
MPIKPSVVQNRFYPGTKWEVPLRKLCRDGHIIFQSFWTFTGNPKLMQSKPVVSLAEELDNLGVQEAKVLALYALVVGLGGVTVLDGTTKFERMKADLEGLEIVGKWAEGEGKEKWEEHLRVFKETIGESEEV